MKEKILLLLLLGILLAGTVYADVEDTTEKIFDKLEDFLHAYDTDIIDGERDFSGDYSTERKIIDGMLFFILFLSISILGLRKWYGKSTAAINGIAISLSALMTIALMSYTKITIGLLFPFAKNMLFFIMLFVVYSIVSDKVVKSKGWAFILAILLTLIMFNAEGLIEDTARGGDYSPVKTTRKAVDVVSNYRTWKTPPPPLKVLPTCYDKMQNQGETGIDCGGPCLPCEKEVKPPTKGPEKKEPKPAPTPTAPRVDSKAVKEIKAIVGNLYGINMYHEIYKSQSGSETSRKMLRDMGITKDYGTLRGWEDAVNKIYKNKANWKNFKSMVETYKLIHG